MNPFKSLLEGLDPVLHERGRLAIVSALAAAPQLRPAAADYADALMRLSKLNAASQGD